METLSVRSSGTLEHLTTDIKSGNIFTIGDTYTLIIDGEVSEEYVKSKIESHGVKVNVRFEGEMARKGYFTYAIEFLDI